MLDSGVPVAERGFQPIELHFAIHLAQFGKIFDTWLGTFLTTHNSQPVVSMGFFLAGCPHELNLKVWEIRYGSPLAPTALGASRRNPALRMGSPFSCFGLNGRSSQHKNQREREIRNLGRGVWKMSCQPHPFCGKDTFAEPVERILWRPPPFATSQPF